MNRFFAAIFCSMALLVMFASCESTNSAQPFSVKIHHLTIDSVCPLFRNYDYPACHIVMNLDAPLADQKSPWLAGLEKALVALPRDGAFAMNSDGTIEGMTSAYVREFFFQYLLDGKEAIDSYHGDAEAASSWLNYEEKVDGKVCYNADGIVSYNLRTESYSGGAHSNISLKNCVYDCRSSRVICLSDLFSPDSLPKVGALMRGALLKEYGCATLEELAAKGQFFEPSEIEPTDCFIVSDKGVSWMFAPFEIAPYAMDVVTVTLPWSELVPLMLDGSPLKDLSEMYSL